MQNKKILVTGFGPFPGMPENPSAQLVMTLAQPRIAKAFNLEARILPTKFSEAGPALARAIAEVRPDIVVCFGVASKTDTIRVERAAWNVVDPVKQDEAGHRHKGNKVRADGPEGYGTTLPVPDIVADLTRAGFMAGGSNDAGDYLCNYIFYQLMHDIATCGQKRMGGFVHIPVPREGAKLSAGGIADAAVMILRACVRDTGPHEGPRILKDRKFWTGKNHAAP
jgi:pyroglutamyl-peptidase